jgi:branched-chain amino acid transport system ATP-binding protein
VLLSVENIDVNYGPVKALRNLSLNVEIRQIVAITGSYGSGKTTLLRAISGLVRPTAGRIAWAPSDERPVMESIHHLAPHQIVELGIAHVPQGRAVVPDLSVRENLLLGAYQRTLRPAIASDIQDLYDRFHVLDKARGKSTLTLRAHEQQMLALCRALMSRPRLLLIDEPAYGLHPQAIDRLCQTLSHLRDDGLTILVTDRDGGRISDCADRVIHLDNGAIARDTVDVSVLLH